jgi:hypothetical protein
MKPQLSEPTSYDANAYAATGHLYLAYGMNDSLDTVETKRIDKSDEWETKGVKS